MRVFYKSLLCFSAVLLTLFGCSMDPVADEIKLENYKLNIAFDREKFDFQNLQEINELSPINIGESLKVEAILDSHKVSFEDLAIDAVVSRRSFAWPLDPIAAGTTVQFPNGSFTHTENNIDTNNPKYDWARIDTGRVKISITNDMVQLDSLVVTVTKTPLPGESPILFKYNTGLFEMGQTKKFTYMLNDQYIKRGMKLIATAYFNEISTSTNSPLDFNDSLIFSYEMGECSFDSARAYFASQKIIDDSLYAIKASNITEIREIVGKNAKINISVKNNTGFLLDMRTKIDSLFNLRTNTYQDTRTFEIQPYVTGVLEDGISLDSCRLRPTVNHENKPSVMVRSTTYCRSDSGTAYVTYKKGQEAWLYVRIAKNNTSDQSFQAYLVDGKMINDTLEIEREARAVSGDIDWSDFEGIHADSLKAKLTLDVNRNDLKLQEVKFKDFLIQGRKTLANGGTHSSWYPLIIPAMTNVNDTSVYIAGLEDVINFHPDTLVYSGKAVTTYDGKLYETDLIDLELGFGVPMQITTSATNIGDPALTQHGDVDSLDALNDSESMDIEAVKINLDAFINNPKHIDAKMRLTVRIADDIVYKNGSTVEDDSLAGNIITLMSADIQQKDNSGNYSYMISKIMGKPVELDKAAITQMLKNKTYIQQTLEVLHQGAGHPIIMKPTDYIEVQLKIAGDLNVTLDFDKK